MGCHLSGAEYPRVRGSIPRLPTRTYLSKSEADLFSGHRIFGACFAGVWVDVAFGCPVVVSSGVWIGGMGRWTL
jgi:hypothetical protein